MKNLYNLQFVLQIVVVGIASMISTLISEQIMRWVVNSEWIANEQMRILVMSLVGLVVFGAVVFAVVRTFYAGSDQMA